MGTHCDLHFKVIHENIEQLEKDTEGVYKILSCMSAILKELQEQSVRKSEDKNPYLNFGLLKLRKSSLMIAILGLLVFILTPFCMKQQNDYALLNQTYHRQGILIKEMQPKADSLRNAKTVKNR